MLLKQPLKKNKIMMEIAMCIIILFILYKNYSDFNDNNKFGL